MRFRAIKIELKWPQKHKWISQNWRILALSVFSQCRGLLSSYLQKQNPFQFMTFYSINFQKKLLVRKILKNKYFVSIFIFLDDIYKNFSEIFINNFFINFVFNFFLINKINVIFCLTEKINASTLPFEPSSG